MFQQNGTGQSANALNWWAVPFHYLFLVCLIFFLNQGVCLSPFFLSLIICILLKFLLDIFYIYIWNLTPFPGFPSETPYSIPLPLCINLPLPLPVLAFPYTGAMEPSQVQRPLFSLMSDQAILCYPCGWSHGSLLVYSLVGALVPGSSGVAGWFILLFLLWGCKPVQFLGSFL